MLQAGSNLSRIENRCYPPPPPPTGVSSFSQEWGELLFQTKILDVGSFLGHLSLNFFSDGSYRLGPKIRQTEGAGVAITPH